MGNVTVHLFSEVRILGDAAFTHKPIDHQHGEQGTLTTCYVRARGSIDPFHWPPSLINRARVKGYHLLCVLRSAYVYMRASKMVGIDAMRNPSMV